MTATSPATEAFVKAIRESIKDKIEKEENNTMDVVEETTIITLVKHALNNQNETKIQNDNYLEVENAVNDLITQATFPTPSSTVRDDNANQEYGMTTVAVPSYNVNEQNNLPENENQQSRLKNNSVNTNTDEAFTNTVFLNVSNESDVTNAESLNSYKSSNIITEECLSLQCNNSKEKMPVFNDISQDVNFVDYNTTYTFSSDIPSNLNLKEGDLEEGIEKQTVCQMDQKTFWTPSDKFISTTKIQDMKVSEETDKIGEENSIIPEVSEETDKIGEENSIIDNEVLEEVLNEMNKTLKFQNENDLVSALFKMNHSIEDYSVNLNRDIPYENKDMKSHFENEPFYKNRLKFSIPDSTKIQTDRKIFHDTILSDYDVSKYADIGKNHRQTKTKFNLEYFDDKDLNKNNTVLLKLDRQDSGTATDKLDDVHNDIPAKTSQPIIQVKTVQNTNGYRSMFNKTLVIKLYLEESDEMYASLAVIISKHSFKVHCKEKEKERLVPPAVMEKGSGEKPSLGLRV
ncbi:hypothetical protein WDU94_002434 [Cyamophila willieti]